MERVIRVEFVKSLNIAPDVQCAKLPNEGKGFHERGGLRLSAELGGIAVRHPSLGEGVTRIIPWSNVASYDVGVMESVRVVVDEKAEKAELVSVRPVTEPEPLLGLAAREAAAEKPAPKKPAPAKKRGPYKKRSGKGVK